MKLMGSWHTYSEGCPCPECARTTERERLNPPRTFWFADVGDDDDQDKDPRWPWQPFLQIDNCCFPLPIWFASGSACTEFIARIPSGA